LERIACRLSKIRRILLGAKWNRKKVVETMERDIESIEAGASQMCLAEFEAAKKHMRDGDLTANEAAELFLYRSSKISAEAAETISDMRNRFAALDVKMSVESRNIVSRWLMRVFG